MSESLTHDKFNADDADVIIQSSDHILFRLHRKHLEAHTGAFPGTDVETCGEVVELSEPANLLQILFAFTLPQRYPDLEDLGFKILLALSEAVEKYEVYAAMYPCTVGLHRYTQKYPTQILAHGLKHNYSKLIDEAAQHLLFLSPVLTAEKLPSTYILSWLRYHQSCQDYIFYAAENIVNAMKIVYPGRCYPYENPRQICRSCRFILKAWLDVVRRLSSRSEIVTALQEYQHYPQDIPHANCRDCWNSDRCLYLEEIAKRCLGQIDSVPSFTSFLRDEVAEVARKAGV